MDFLPLSILTNVNSFLPWKDRLVARQLSSKFLTPLISKEHLKTLRLERKKDHFLFTLQWEKEEKALSKRAMKKEARKQKKKTREGEKRRIIEIINAPDIVNTPRTLVIDGILTKETTVSCPEAEQYRQLIMNYIEILFTFFSCERLDLRYLSPGILSKIDESKLKGNLCPETIQWVELHTVSCGLPPEERNLLELCRIDYSLFFRPSSMFYFTEYFLELMSPNDVVLSFEGRGYLPGEDRGLSEDSIRQLLNRRQISFRASIPINISVDYFMEYIQIGLGGGYIMYLLAVFHTFTPADVERLRDWLKLTGFKQEDQCTMSKIVKSGPVENDFDPDRLLVTINYRYFEILADYAFWRRTESIH